MNNEKHEKTKRLFKILGITFSIIGLICTLIGMISFFRSFAKAEPPKLFFFAFIGLPLLGIGGMLITTGFRREMMTYSKNEGVPVVNEALNEVSPTISKVVNEAHTSIKKVKCSCGELNDEGSKYCKSCGKELQKRCPSCNEVVDPDSSFCNHCGKKL